MTRTEYKRRWRERNRKRYLTKRRIAMRAWYAKNKPKLKEKLKARRQTARDRGRCGICVTRYCEPGYKTCLHCRDAINGRRQIKRELAA
jgi:hypothetical protein